MITKYQVVWSSAFVITRTFLGECLISMLLELFPKISSVLWVFVNSKSLGKRNLSRLKLFIFHTYIPSYFCWKWVHSSFYHDYFRHNETTLQVRCCKNWNIAILTILHHTIGNPCKRVTKRSSYFILDQLVLDELGYEPKSLFFQKYSCFRCLGVKSSCKYTSISIINNVRVLFHPIF